MSAPESPTHGLRFDLAALAQELRAEPSYAREGHTARTLVRTSDLRVVLVVLRAGKKLLEHHVNVTASVYQSLISVFDDMTPAQQMEFVDMAAMYSKLDAGGRQALVELMAIYYELWAADRIALHELAQRLAANSDKKK